LTIGGRQAARFVFGDRLRPAASATVAALHRQGVRVCLVSGDSEGAARRMGAAAGVNEAAGELLPEQKAAFVKSLQARGQRVAMVGDGLNDSLALAQSDLAVSLYSGAALDREAADVTLMAGNPAQLPVFFELARRANRVVLQNLVGALVYNALSIPIAAAGLLTPLWAVGAMLLSSLTVIGNTLRLVACAKGARPEDAGGNPAS
jgi:P-type E1-E2 ATPase